MTLQGAHSDGVHDHRDRGPIPIIKDPQMNSIQVKVPEEEVHKVEVEEEVLLLEAPRVLHQRRWCRDKAQMCLGWRLRNPVIQTGQEGEEGEVGTGRRRLEYRKFQKRDLDLREPSEEDDLEGN